ncbi:MAG: SdpI family protein [Lachnospiraceae bacterium]|nr:SdpI family protein [Lachnospiraceae bacterium]
MLKANKKTLIITSIVTVLPIFAGLFLWDRLPDTMAIHFGINSGADGFSSKAFAVIGLPLIMLALEWIAAFVTAHDPKKQNISPKIFAVTLWLFPLISLAVAAAIYAYNLGSGMNAALIGGLILGVLLIVAGNYLPKARQNYTFGYKIPWTLADEDNWNRTHRLAGFLWMAGGILIVVGTLTGSSGIYAAIAVLAAAALIPIIYSYILHIKKEK